MTQLKEKMMVVLLREIKNPKSVFKLFSFIVKNQIDIFSNRTNFKKQWLEIYSTFVKYDLWPDDYPKGSHIIWTNRQLMNHLKISKYDTFKKMNNRYKKYLKKEITKYE